MKIVELEIQYLNEKRNSLQWVFDKYVSNYHHSMMWIATISIGIMAIMISLESTSSIWIAVTLYLIITSYRLFMLNKNGSLVKESLTKIDKEIDKRYNKLRIDSNKLTKTILPNVKLN